MILQHMRPLTVCLLSVVFALAQPPQHAAAHGNSFGWGIAAGVATGFLLSEAYRSPRYYYGPPYAYGMGYYGVPPYYGGYYARPYRSYSYNRLDQRPYYRPYHGDVGPRPYRRAHRH